MSDYDDNISASLINPLSEVDQLLARSQQAKEKGDLKYALFLDHWALQGLLFRQKDYARAYDLAVQTALDCRRPIHKDQMERICVHEDLIFTYIGIDPIGYAELIEDALQYMEQEIVHPTSCYYCLLEARSAFELSYSNLDKATAAVQNYYSESQADYHHHFGISHTKVCELMYMHQAWEKLLYFGQKGEEVILNRTENAEYVAIVIAAQALALRKLGYEKEATTAYRRAVTRAGSLHIGLHHSYYNFLCDYHTAAGDLQAAIDLRKRQLQDMGNMGQPYWEAQARLMLIGLLKQQGTDFQDQIKPTRELISKLRQPDMLTTVLDKITEN